jgi:hypothetical protein
MINYEDLISVSIYDLLKAGHLAALAETSFTIPSLQGDPTQITLTINTAFITVSDQNNDPYRIQLLTKPFNLNNGNLWYFICPLKQTPCIKLYYHNGCFQSRQAIKGRYRQQVASHNTRQAVKQLTDLYQLDKMLKKVTLPRNRSTYRGRPTASNKKIIAKIQSINEHNNIRNHSTG